MTTTLPPTPKGVIYRCNAEHYPGDRPHLWTIVDGKQQFVWATAGGVSRRKRVQTCNEHRPPSDLTPETLTAGIALPGFTVTQEVERWPAMTRTIEYPVVKLEGAGVTFRIIFTERQPNEKINSYSTRAAGHTDFTTALGTRTFDRRGVDDSFYVYFRDTVEDVRTTLEDQLKRVAESRARLAKSESVPVIGFAVTPELKAQIITRLQNRGTHTFTPSGFGTGYVLSMRSSRYSHRAATEIEKFFGVSPIYFETRDCD